MIRDTFVLRNGEFVPKRLAEPLNRANAAPTVISDLPEYRPVAADKHTGKRPIIGGRRQHREFLSRNGYQEVGNDYTEPKHEQLSRENRIGDIRRSFRD